MDTQNLQIADLPELDSVTAGGGKLLVFSLIGIAVVSLFFGAVVGTIFTLIRVTGQHAQFNLVESIAVGLAGAVVSALLMLRTNWFDYQWTTDSAGLTIKGLSHTRRIDWSQVTSAGGRVSTGDRMTCTLQTTKGKVVLGDLFDKAGGLMGASLYQHLRKYGKADESLLSSASRTFWMPIPREVPTEMDWHNPNPPGWSVTLAVTLLVLIAIPVIYYLGPRVDWGHVWNYLHNLVGAIIPLGYYKFRERLIAAHSVSVRRDGIEMRTARRMIYLPWREVTHVQWHQQHSLFTVGRSTYRDVAIIRYRRDDPVSATAILSIIRQLRAVHHAPPVVIPPPMRTMLIDKAEWRSGVAAPTGSVEARPVRGQLIILTVFVAAVQAITIITLWGKDIVPAYAMIGLVIVALMTLRWLIRQCTTVYRADSEGITVKSSGGRKQIRWSDVSSYTIAPSGTTAKRILQDSSGGLLLLALPEGSRHENDVFLAYVDAKLAPVRKEHPSLTR